MPSHHPHNELTVRDHVRILLTEYDALYALVQFRMTSLDRRAPTATISLVAFLAAITALPADVQGLSLLAVPLVMVWLVRTTVNHARSFEDVLSRLAEIERAINQYAHAEVLVFQSRHPSRGRAVGGRTGQETIRSVFVVCALFLAACAYFAFRMDTLPPPLLVLYVAYVAIVFGVLVRHISRLRRYRYRSVGARRPVAATLNPATPDPVASSR